eukprot:TRINITY_DN7236_c0_g1_i4.p1 TRINITY_DN7236_c0_g1~~TRINITY_DN7236_c0_g1_i4.p1  ORF type:complete len:493 (+),score=101.39 TRINITY_DN7236_c0_g1_i4:50-1528(+)
MAAESTGFWRRMTGRGPGRAQPVMVEGSNGKATRKSFNAFDDSNSGAWSDGEDELTISHASGESAPATSSMAPSAPQVRNRRSISQPAQPGSKGQPATNSAQKPTRSASNNSMQAAKKSSPSRPLPRNASTTSLPAEQLAPKADQSSQHFIASVASSRQRRSSSELRTRDEMRSDKFQECLSATSVDMKKLKELAWSGCPRQFRPTVWMLLSGYAPANASRREVTLQRKREEYRGFVEQYYDTRLATENEKTFHQIQIDVLRTSPATKTFQQPCVKEMLERILYIWAIRHPASGYVQGMNDLVTPFFAVFMQPHSGVDIADCAVESIPKDTRDVIEADSFWCFSRLLDGIQDNYTAQQPGVQRKTQAMEELVMRIDRPLFDHLQECGVAFIQFAFRWINCLLMREMPLRCTVRLWDTYLAETDGFADFHVYVCGAFLTTFSSQIRTKFGLDELMPALQSLPTAAWGNKEIELVLAEAYRLKYMFADSQKHLG